MGDQVVIDLISSSPPPGGSLHPRPQAPSETVTIVPKKRTSGEAPLDVADEPYNRSPRQAAKRTVVKKGTNLVPGQRDGDDIWLLPDLSSDHAEHRRSPTASARRRRSPSFVANKPSTRRKDPIEFSSTPVVPKYPPAAARHRDSDGLDLSDWFPSSPPKGRHQPKPDRRAKPLERKALERRTEPSFQFLDDLDDLDSPPAPRRRREWDPISSSAPERSTEQGVIELDSASEAGDLNQLSDDSFPDVLDIAPSQHDILRAHARSKTKKKPAAAKPKVTATKTAAAKTATAKTATAKKTVEERTLDKETRAAAREEEKERKLREKEAAKAEKAKEKLRATALAEANKVRTDRKVSGKEMIVDLASTLDLGVTVQVQTLLKDLGIEDAQWTSPVPRVVRWRRKIRARWDDEAGHYEPIPERIETDTYALVVMDAEEFVNCCLGVDDNDLDRHVRLMKGYFDDHSLMYLLQGLGPWMRKNRNLRNRQYTSAVRGDAESDQASSRRKTVKRTEYVDEEAIEDALLRLQVVHGAQVHHTNAGIETAQWITTLTQHLATVPYRQRRDDVNASAAAFCMESGQVRTGDDANDAYIRMLQEISRITAPIAYGIAAEFPSVSKLVRGLEQGGPLTLQDCRKGANRDGDLTERTVGQAVSKRMYKVFTGCDESSADI